MKQQTRHKNTPTPRATSTIEIATLQTVPCTIQIIFLYCMSSACNKFKNVSTISAIDYTAEKFVGSGGGYNWLWKFSQGKDHSEYFQFL
jgi:hypothetical protein